jgi:hypothetical protein
MRNQEKLENKTIVDQSTISSTKKCLCYNESFQWMDDEAALPYFFFIFRLNTFGINYVQKNWTMPNYNICHVKFFYNDIHFGYISSYCRFTFSTWYAIPFYVVLRTDMGHNRRYKVYNARQHNVLWRNWIWKLYKIGWISQEWTRTWNMIIDFCSLKHS